MNWSETRKKLLHLASRRATRCYEEPPRTAHGGPGDDSAWSGAEPAPRDRRAASLCVASGKGGTGKTALSASLAHLLSSRGRTLIIDADLGVGNAHILQGASPVKTFVDVAEGRATVREILTPCSETIDLLAAGSGVPRMAELNAYEMHLIATGLEDLELDYRYMLIDSAAGVSRQTMAFAAASDLTLIVTTPDLTAMTDAYAFLKVLIAQSQQRPLLLVNRAQDEEQAFEVRDRILRVCDRFLGRVPLPIGWLPEDPAVGSAGNRRGPVAALEPQAEFSAALRRKVGTILEELGRTRAQGVGRRLLGEVAFARQLA